MMPRRRVRGRLATTLLAAALGACGATDCGGCLIPLEDGFPEGGKVNGVVQTRLTPAGISFMNARLPEIIQSFVSIPCDPALPDAERVPCPEGTGCVGGDHCESGGQPRSIMGFRIPYIISPDNCDLEICPDASFDECLAYFELLDVQLTPTSPNRIDVAVQTFIWTTDIPTKIDGSIWPPQCWISPDCTISVTRNERELTTTVHLRTDNPLQRLDVQIGEPSIPLEADDIPIEGHLGCDFIDWIKPLIFPLLEDTIRDKLNEAVLDATTDMLVEGCDGSADPPERCTPTVASTCDGDQRCHFAIDDRYIPRLLGVEGALDLSALLGEFAGDATGVSLSAGAGGYAEVEGGGIEVGLRGGADAEPAGCVPPLGGQPPAPPRLDFGDRVTPAEGGAAFGYMVGVGVSDWLVDELVRKILVSGTLCQRLDAGLSGYINTGALGLLASSLGRITRGGAKPALIEILPRAPFEVDLGLGTTAPDPGDPNRTVLDKPLITVRARDVDLDMYAMVDDRFVRFMTMRTALNVGVGLSDDGQGNLMLLMSGPEDWIGDVEVLNSELLTDAPEDIAAAVPALVSALLGQLAPSLNQTFEIPDLAGFLLTDLLIQGAHPRTSGGSPVLDADGNQVYEFVGLYANLDFDGSVGAPLRYVVETEAAVAHLQLPPLESFSVRGPGGPQLPELVLSVAGSGHGAGEIEFTHRVDGGFWRPFHRGELLHVTDPILQLMGRHLVEVRGRLPGVPESLDPTPAAVEVLIDPLPPEARIEIDAAAMSATVVASDAVTPAEALVVRHRLDHGPWVSQRGLAPLALGALPGADHALEVEVIDEVGNSTTLLYGTLPAAVAGPVQLPRPPQGRGQPLATAAEVGCVCGASSTPGGAVALLIALALVARRRRC